MSMLVRLAGKARAVGRYRFVLPFYMKVLWPLAAKSPFVAAMYYALFDRSFYSEFTAAVSGKRHYYALNRSLAPNPFLLRRSIHRLEKGLTAIDRRSVFGTSYIAQTVKNFSRCRENLDSHSRRWAEDVLTEFFAVSGSHSEIDAARSEFDQVAAPQSGQGERQAPFLLTKSSRVNFDAMKALALDRRSVRAFEQHPVPLELIEQAAEVALLSPSACNRQPFNFYYFTRRETIEAVASIPKGAKGFMHNIPFLAAVVGDLSAFVAEDDRHIIYVDGALAAMSFMFALETLGLSSCPINWPSSASTDRRFARLVGVAPYQRVVLLIAVGYQKSDALIPRSGKKSPGHLLFDGDAAIKAHRP